MGDTNLQEEQTSPYIGLTMLPKIINTINEMV